MYRLVNDQVYEDGRKIGQWRGLVFYPEPGYHGMPIHLMRFLLSPEAIHEARRFAMGGWTMYAIIVAGELMLGFYVADDAELTDDITKSVTYETKEAADADRAIIEDLWADVATKVVKVAWDHWWLDLTRSIAASGLYFGDRSLTMRSLAMESYSEHAQNLYAEELDQWADYRNYLLQEPPPYEPTVEELIVLGEGDWDFWWLDSTESIAASGLNNP
jgi:hypothetical protein